MEKKSQTKSTKSKAAETDSAQKTAKQSTTVKKTESATKAPVSTTKTKTVAEPKVTEKSEPKKPAAKKEPAPSKTEKAASASAAKPSATKESAKTAKSSAEKKPAATEKVAAKKKEEKPAKESSATKEPQKENRVKAAALAVWNNKKARLGLMIAASALLILCLVLGLVLGLSGNGHRITVNAYASETRVGYHGEYLGKADRYKPVDGTRSEGAAFNNTDGIYPKYGSTVSVNDDATAKSNIINESAYLCAFGTAGANRGDEIITPDKYTYIDKDGYLWRRGSANNSACIGADDPVPAMELLSTNAETGEKSYSTTQRRLYKHSAAAGMYLGDVADNEPGIVKKITATNRGYSSYGITGIYAPAGEVLKVEISGKDMRATGGLTFHIGQALYNGQANNIWAAKSINRMPHILTTLTLNRYTTTYDEATDTYTGYIGSFLGGPVYIRNNSATYSVTISGGVAYKHFILGYTTPEEFERNAKSTAPMFDLEVWEYGVLHSGPKKYAESFSYDDLYKAAVLWEKVSLVTTQRGNGYKQGIVFLYDPFVAAGAAVAFPGRSSVNCPLGWMPQSLNYNSLVTSGSWGNFHEYHHNFQGFGVGGGADGEVTNNSLNLVSYALFTKISSSRRIGSYGGEGLGGWNNYTSATWALNQVNTGSITSTNGLAVYATLLHNFGADAYIKNAKGSNNDYWTNWSNYTGYDMSYYAKLVSAYTTGSNPDALHAAQAELPMFVPVSCVYQTGRSYGTGEGKKNITTMQPYVIPYGYSFGIDLSEYSAPNGQYAGGSIVVPDGITYTIKKVDTSGLNGKLEKTGDFTYTLHPGKADTTGKIVVTLELGQSDSHKATYGEFKLDDVDLILEFQQSHEMKKTTLDRTVYTYSADKMYTDAVMAFENGFKGYTAVTTEDHYNPTQNCNTDIWYRPDNESTREQFANEPDKYFIHENQIDVVDGKLYFEEDGKYRIFLRGRTNCALYFSMDGKEYQLGAAIKTTLASGSDKFRVTDSNTYFDVEFKEGACTATVYVNEGKTYPYTLKKDGTGQIRNWVYLKEILIDTSVGAVSYIGVGFNAWSQAMFTVADTYHNKDGGIVADTNDANYAYTQSTYSNYAGTAVAATRTYKDGKVKNYSISGGKYTETTANEVARLTKSELIAPTSASYATAYRTSYEFKNSDFTSDYFYTRDYSDSYLDNVDVPTDEITVTDTNYTATGWGSGMPITNVTDGKTNTYIHTSWQVSANNPLKLTFDLGDVRTINRITFTCRNNNGMLETPRDFTIEGSTDGVAFFTIGEYTDAPRDGNRVVVNFPETTLRYCRIVISAAHQGNGSYYIVIGEVTFTHSTEVLGGAKYSPDNDMFRYYGKWSLATEHSNFGHVYVGKRGARVEFEFEGTQLGVISSNSLKQKFEVYIDGKKVESIALKKDDGTYQYTFISPELKEGKHKVKIKCTGEANFDSFIVFP